tara:strand:- start:131 stop:352 length:222 start_codon:yes stop_codon:yes gene_type:complete
MAMPEFRLTVDGEEKIYDTEKLNEKQTMAYKECVVVEKELKRHRFLSAILEDRKNFLLNRIATEEDTSDEEET